MRREVHGQPGLPVRSPDRAHRLLERKVPSGCNTLSCFGNEHIRQQAGIRLGHRREIPDKRQIELDSRFWQANEEEAPAINAAPVPASRPPD